VGAGLLDERVEGVGCAAQALETGGARDFCGFQRALGVEQGQGADARLHLRPVVEASLLSLPARRLEAGGEYLRRHRASSIPRPRHQHQRQVRAANADAPTPSAGITGCILRLSSASSCSTTTGRTPEYPRASTLARSSMTARTSLTGSGSPTPPAWLRIRLSCSSRMRAGGIVTSASAPKPVVMP
jgi:hypothetical protein